MREGICSGCRRMRMVNVATFKDVILGEFCADCYDRLDLAEPRRIPPGCYGPSEGDTSPGWENVVRCYEEDR